MAKHIVVVGGGLGGLVAAIYGRLHHHDVTLIEPRALGGKAAPIECEGYRLDPGPSIIILTNIYREVFADAGENMDDFLQFTRIDPITRVFFQNEVFDIAADLQASLAMLGEISKKDATALGALLETIDSVESAVTDTIFKRPMTSRWQLVNPSLIRFGMKLGQGKPYKQVVDGMFESALMRAFFYGFPAYSGQSYHSVAPGAFLIPHAMFRTGVYYPVGGVAAIPLAFAALAERLGVQFRMGARVHSVKTSGTKVTGVTLDSGESIACDGCISNLDRTTFGTMLGRDPKGTPSFSYFTLHYGVRQADEGQLKHHNLIIPDDWEGSYHDIYDKGVAPRDPIVYVNETSAIDASTAPGGCRNIFGVVTVPAKNRKIDWTAEEPRMNEEVRKVLSGAGVNLNPDAVDFERMQSPNTFESRDGNFGGSLFGPDDADRLWGMFPMPNRDREFRNLAYCGGSVQPGAGLPMVTLSGRFAVESLRF